MDKKSPNRFTIRVYGLLIHQNQILLSRENIFGTIYNKLPGGGLEFGEGAIDCVKREFMEEVAIEIHSTKHFYTTEEYYPSAFDSSQQVLSIYYIVETDQINDIKIGDPEDSSQLKQDDDQVLYWCPISKLKEEPMHFPIDQIVISKLLRP